MLIVVLCAFAIAMCIHQVEFRKKSPNRFINLLGWIGFGSGLLMQAVFRGSENTLPRVAAVINFAACISLILVKLWLMLQARSERKAGEQPST